MTPREKGLKAQVERFKLKIRHTLFDIGSDYGVNSLVWWVILQLGFLDYQRIFFFSKGNAAAQSGLKGVVYGLIKSNYASAKSPELTALPERAGSPSPRSLRNWRPRSRLRCAPRAPPPPSSWKSDTNPRRGEDRAAGPPPRGHAGKRRGRPSIPRGSGFGYRGPGGLHSRALSGSLWSTGSILPAAFNGKALWVFFWFCFSSPGNTWRAPCAGWASTERNWCRWNLPRERKSSSTRPGAVKAAFTKTLIKKKVQWCSHSGATHGIFIIHKIFSLSFLCRTSFSGSLQPTLKIVVVYNLLEILAPYVSNHHSSPPLRLLTSYIQEVNGKWKTVHNSS